MRQRLISAAVLVPVVVIAFLSGPLWIGLGIALLAGIAAYEAARLVRSAGLGADPSIPTAAAGVAVIGLPFALGLPFAEQALAVAGFALAVVAAPAIAAFRFSNPREGFLSWAGSVLTSFYASLLAGATGILVIGPAMPESAPLSGLYLGGMAWLLVLVVTVWTLDSAAYVAGRYHGRGRFMNHISPNKTWSGAIGGTVAAVGVCAVLVSATGQSLLIGIVLGVIIAVAAQAGDLVESMLKRAAGAKDSGTWVPGHGGVLDRVDSFLFAAPALFVSLGLLNLVARTP